MQGEGAMLGSLLMVEACSDREGGGLDSDTAEPPDWMRGHIQLHHAY